MISIDVPDLVENELDFRPVSVERGADVAQPGTFLAGRIRLGGPICVPITPEYVAADADLQTFVEQEAGRFAYHLVHLSVTFVAEPEKPRLERAEVELTLSANRTDAPTAWSMAPELIADASTVTTSIQLSPKLSLSVGGANVGAELGSIGRERERSGDAVYLVAENSMRADPRWRFRRTRSRPLRGAQRLALVVRTPWQAEATLAGQVSGATLHGTFLRRELADLPWPLRFRTEF